MAKVFGNGYNPRTPVYFATTVSRDNLEDVEPYLRLEGLVNRVVAEKGTNQIDVERTRHLLFDVYVMKSMLDPKVAKDENTRGLLINYAASYLALAGEYQKMNRNADAELVLNSALRFNLDKDRKVPLLYHASVFAMLNAHYDEALALLDSIQAYGFSDPELMLRRGYAYQGKGELAKAEESYRAAATADPTRPEAVQALHRLYLDEMHDTARARGILEDWLRRSPGDSMATQMLHELS
jgi:tetratricopeptide (TPR) repeat protein